MQWESDLEDWAAGWNAVRGEDAPPQQVTAWEGKLPSRDGLVLVCPHRASDRVPFVVPGQNLGNSILGADRLALRAGVEVGPRQHVAQLLDTRLIGDEHVNLGRVDATLDRLPARPCVSGDKITHNGRETVGAQGSSAVDGVKPRVCQRARVPNVMQHRGGYYVEPVPGGHEVVDDAGNQGPDRHRVCLAGRVQLVEQRREGGAQVCERP